MNDKRRQKLMEAKDLLSRASQQIDEMLCQERDCLDNIPENLSGSEKYEKSEQAVDKMEDAISAIEEAEEAITEACE